MSRPHRLRSEPYVGIRRYFLTICTHNRARHFRRPEVVVRTWSQFLRTAIDESFAILAYCFMPDHVHVVVEGMTDAAHLARFVSAAKQRSAFLFARDVGGRLWQEGYFERIIRCDEDLPTLIGYVIANPVRAGLVENPADYPHWGSQKHSREGILEFVGSRRRG